MNQILTNKISFVFNVLIISKQILVLYVINQKVNFIKKISLKKAYKFTYNKIQDMKNLKIFLKKVLMNKYLFKFIIIVLSINKTLK